MAKSKNIIGQNKKGALLEFLFGSQDSIAGIEPEKDFQAKIENLQQQLNSLQEKVIHLENQLKNPNTISEAPKRAEKASFNSEQYNLSFNQNQPQNPSYFKTLKDIPEEEIIEIIKRGFQLQAQGKISLKKYYESKEEYSLFHLKGYSIKYESIRRTKLYLKLKA